MTQAKNFYLANLRLFSATLLATTAYSLNSTRIAAQSLPEAFAHQLLSSESAPIDRDLKHGQDGGKNLAVLSSLKQQLKPNVLLVDKTGVAATNADEKESSARLLRLITLSCLFLFFVPLGIFYPLFLFYKMLLVKSDESDRSNDILNGDRQEELTESANSIDSVLQAEQDVNQATVSKLQIAFSPPASQLREELNRVTVMSDLNVGDDLVDLMHQIVTVLIEQGHWTHANYSSTTLPLAKVRPEFDSISAQERSKFASKTLSSVNHNLNVSINGDQESYSYVVVTLILCTSHTAPLHQKINTKEQLVQELIQLGKMEKDSVIEFEVLWNPQPESLYLSNAQLLTEYADMTRLL